MRRISDLLDDYQENSIQLREDSPLSKDRIKRLTMERIQVQKTRRVRVLPKLAAAVIAISILAVTAVAAEYVWGVKDWFCSAFNSRAEEIRDLYEKKSPEFKLQGNLTAEQLVIIESIGQVKNERVTTDGGSITLTAVCSDEYVMHLYFRVEAPGGTVLAEDERYSFDSYSLVENTHQMKDRTNLRKPSMTVEGETFYTPREIQIRDLPDENPADNCMDFLVTIISGGVDGYAPVKLNDGVKKTIKLYGLFVKEETDGKETLTNVMPGEYVFDITNEREGKWMDVDVEGLECLSDSHVDNSLIGPEAEMKTLRISPLSMQWENTGTILVPKIYMKDGSKVVGTPGFKPSVRRPGEVNTSEGYEIFYVPINTSHIDYIQLGDEKIYVNQWMLDELPPLMTGDMTDAQLAILESIGQVKNETIESEGTSITLQAMCSDEYTMYLYFKIAAPEGVVLPDGWHYSFIEPPKLGYVTRRSKHITVREYKVLSNSAMTLQALPDEDPSDNKKDFLLVISSTSQSGERTTSLNDGVRKVLNLDGLYASETSDDFRNPDKVQLLFEGDFNFDITNEVESKRIDVDVAGITYETSWTRYPAGEEPEGESAVVTADSLRIGPLSLEWVTEGADWSSGYVEVRMKDGTKPVFSGNSFSSRDGKTVEIRRFYLPVDLEQIDYVMINDQYKIDINP